MDDRHSVVGLKTQPLYRRIDVHIAPLFIFATSFPVFRIALAVTLPNMPLTAIPVEHQAIHDTKPEN